MTSFLGTLLIRIPLYEGDFREYVTIARLGGLLGLTCLLVVTYLQRSHMISGDMLMSSYRLRSTLLFIPSTFSGMYHTFSKNYVPKNWEESTKINKNQQEPTTMQH